MQNAERPLSCQHLVRLRSSGHRLILDQGDEEIEFRVVPLDSVEDMCRQLTRRNDPVAKRVDGLPGRAKTWIELRLHRTRLRKTTRMRSGVSLVSRFHVGLLACQADRTGNATSQTSSVGPADPKSVK